MGYRGAVTLGRDFRSQKAQLSKTEKKEGRKRGGRGKRNERGKEEGRREEPSRAIGGKCSSVWD